MNKRSSLWNGTFQIVVSLPEGKQTTETFNGSLKSAIRYARNQYRIAVANFYCADGTWLKEVAWRYRG